MNRKLTIAAVAAALVLALAGCGASTGSAPLPQEKPAAAAPAAKAPAAAPAVKAAPAEAPADAASTCDVVREALLTGTPAKVTASMKALIADKTAPATAREYARYHTVRDKGNKDLQGMDESLITMACS